MMGFVARGSRCVVVFTAPSKEEAARVVLSLLAEAGVALEEMEVMEFDPTVAGGVVLSHDEATDE